MKPMTDEDVRNVIDQEERKKSRQFLKSWKVAVKRLGPDLFTVTSATVDTATDRNELRPDPEAIEKYVNTHYNDHHYFLFMVISFFSYSLIENIFKEAGIGWPRIIDLQFLDETERMIIYALIESSEVEW